MVEYQIFATNLLRECLVLRKLQTMCFVRDQIPNENFFTSIAHFYIFCNIFFPTSHYENNFLMQFCYVVVHDV